MPKNVSSTLLNLENMANPNKTSNNNQTSADSKAAPPSSDRVLMQPGVGSTNLLQRVSKFMMAKSNS